MMLAHGPLYNLLGVCGVGDGDGGVCAFEVIMASNRDD
jgi:hypothetical protein